MEDNGFFHKDYLICQQMNRPSSLVVALTICVHFHHVILMSCQLIYISTLGGKALQFTVKNITVIVRVCLSI